MCVKILHTDNGASGRRNQPRGSGLSLGRPYPVCGCAPAKLDSAANSSAGARIVSVHEQKKVKNN